MERGIRITVSRSDPQKKKVTIPQHLRDNNWAESIGSIQKKLDSLDPSQDVVIFDFVKSRWIDPLPLLSLLVEIINLARRGAKVQVSLPSGDNGPSEIDRNLPYQASPNRLLLFLSREGFFAELLKNNIVAFVGVNELTHEVAKKCGALTATASYADAHFIPIWVIDVPILGHTPSISNYPANIVEEIINGTEIALRSRCSPPERRHLLYALRAVLQEFLHNVQEHAYHTNGFRPAALYVRYRQGKTSLSNNPGRDFYEACIKLEMQSCPQLSRDWLDARPGCLEIFFLDRGVGMTQQFANKKKGGDFSNVMYRTFHEGESTKDIRRTEHGGLHLLHNLMGRSNDYVRAIGGQTWFGSTVPFTRPTATVTKPIKKSPLGEGFVGLAYHLRLSWKAATDEPETWERFSQVDIKQIWQELCKPATSCTELFLRYERCTVIDERFRDHQEFPGKEPTTFLMWLPPRGLMKWDILDKFEKLTSHVSSKCTLIIADIPTMEAAMYKAAISQSSFAKSEKWPEKYEYIVLATNRWTFAYAEYAHERHGFTTSQNDEVSRRLKSEFDIPHFNLSFRQIVVHWIKWHDSRRFWQAVGSNERYFLPERVIWSEKENHVPDKIIDGYLDFPATTHNHFCAELYRNSLSRIFGLEDERKCSLVSIDRLTDPVVHDVYVHEVYDPPERDKANLQKIATGSVLVSGFTLQATGISERSVHFFIHGSSELQGSYPALFHWIPDTSILNTASSQKRIGKTSAIAPKGWLSIEIPRDDSTDKDIGYRTPEECYEDWQSSGPVIAKIGHWHYEGHHDLLTINIPDAVADSFNRNGQLAQFLMKNILHPLGVTKKEITRACNEYPSYPTSYPSILVYRSHPSSERIIDNLLGTLDASARQEIMKWIFPVLPLRRRWGGSTLLVPPRMRNEMQIALEKRRKAIVFDDAAITGRTIQDLLTSLRAWGGAAEMQIQVVTIANRLRLPTESKFVKYYWRLDVPTMGRHGSCPLCQALEGAKSLASQIISSSVAYEDLQQWIRTWSQASPITEWDAGLNPLPLPHPQEKSYCYRQEIGKHLYLLNLYRSTGITIHAAEVHAMTASDDYALKKLRELDDPAIQIELAASQLLLFGDELDMDLVRDFIIDGLLGPLAELNADSPYGQLAVLTLMRMLSSVESKQVRKEVARKVSDRIDRLRSLGHGQILLAYLITQELADVNDDMFHAGARLLTSRHRDIATKLRSLFRETVTPLGNIHSEPIPELFTKLSKGVDPYPELWSNALNSLAKLQDIIKELGLDLAASDNGSYKDKCNKLILSLQCAEAAIEKIMISRKQGKLESLDTKNTEAMDCLQQVQMRLNEVADCYFYRIDLNKTHNPDNGHKPEEFIKTLSNIWEEKINWAEVCKTKGVSTPPLVKPSSTSGMSNKFDGIKLTWLLWHTPLQMMIRDLLMNATHITNQITDPWDQSSTDEAHMWVHVGFTPQAAVISIANGDNNPASVFEEIKKGSQNKTRWDMLTNLGGKVDYDEALSQKGVLALQVQIPYAPYLRHEGEIKGE